MIIIVSSNNYIIISNPMLSFQPLPTFCAVAITFQMRRRQTCHVFSNHTFVPATPFQIRAIRILKLISKIRLINFKKEVINCLKLKLRSPAFPKQHGQSRVHRHAAVPTSCPPWHGLASKTFPWRRRAPALSCAVLSFTHKSHSG